jgi:hypothetical protein
VTVTFLWDTFEMPDGRGSFFDVLDRAATRGVDVRVIFWRHDAETAALATNAFWGSPDHVAGLEARGSGVSIRWDPPPLLPAPEELVDAPDERDRGVSAGVDNHGHHPAPGGQPYDIAGGERSIFEQYRAAIAAARSSIYVENQLRTPSIPPPTGAEASPGGARRHVTGYAVAVTPMPAASLRVRHSALDMRVVSTSVACARSAPTVAWSFGVCSKGSQSKNRAAFSHVILWISASLHFAAWSSFHENSGDSGHVVSVCG